MSSKKHGKIISWKWLHRFEYAPESGIQMAKYEDGTFAVNIYNQLRQHNIFQRCCVIPLEFISIKAIIEGLIGLYGKDKVYRELDIE